MGDMNDMMGGMMGGAYLWMALVAVLVIIVAAGAVTLSVIEAKRQTTRRAALPKSDESGEAIEILRRRYAAGQIDEDEFLRRQSMLTPY